MNTLRSLSRSRLAFAVTIALIATVAISVKLWADRSHVASRFKTKAGPWGKIECVRIAVEMPDSFISLAELKGIHSHWFFRGSQSDIAAFLKTIDLTDDQLQSILDLKWEEGIGGYWINPSDELTLSLSKACRQKLYMHLAAFPENAPQQNPFVFREELLPGLLRNSQISDDTIERLKELLYPLDNLLLFADVDVFVNNLPDDEEKIRVLKTISRTATLLVKLKVDEQADIESLVNYWGYGGRSKDVRSLLQSMAAVPGGSMVDVAHLLPSFLRQRIYTYPNPELLNATNQHCHWSSMNFLNQLPDNRFSDEDFVRETVEREFAPVTDAPRLGDVVFFMDASGMVIHSATYIADNIVFTKNGGGVNRPWVYMEMEDLLALYLKPREAVRTVIYRRKSL